MAKSKAGLGKGLQALLSDLPDESESDISEISLDLISPNSSQPRTHFDDEKIKELSLSIKEHGVIQPIIIRPIDNRHYEIVAGERRWRAAQKAQLTKIPAIIRSLSEQEVIEIALIENIQREELSPIEEALALKNLMDRFSYTQNQLAQRLSRSRSAIANILRLIRLPNYIQESVSRGTLSSGHAKLLLSLEDKPATQRQLYNEIIDNGYSVRKTEERIKQLTIKKNYVPRGTPPIPESKVTKDIYLQKAEENLMDHLSTKVTIYPLSKNKRGKVEIEYYSLEDLTRIIEHIQGSEYV